MGFDNDLFWQWCRDKASEGHTLLISEYSAPADFECLLSVEHTSILDKANRVVRIEKLFIYNELL